MRILLCLVSLLALGALASCIHPYSPEIQQGNIVTPEMVGKLKPGMSKSQVRFVLGTPLITDSFHPNRWDYVYQYQKKVGAVAERRHLAVIFEGDAMARIEGDLPITRGPEPATTDTPGASPAPASSSERRPPAL